MHNLVTKFIDYLQNIALNDIYCVEAIFNPKGDVDVGERKIFFPNTISMFLPSNIKEDRKQRAKDKLVSYKEKGLNVVAIRLDYIDNKISSVAFYS